MTPATEPVALNGLLTIITALLTPFLLKWGLDKEGVQSLFAGIGSLATAALSIWAVAHARAQVTPVVAPTDNEGRALTPDTPAPPPGAVG